MLLLSCSVNINFPLFPCEDSPGVYLKLAPAAILFKNSLGPILTDLRGELFVVVKFCVLIST